MNNIPTVSETLDIQRGYAVGADIARILMPAKDSQCQSFADYLTSIQDMNLLRMSDIFGSRSLPVLIVFVSQRDSYFRQKEKELLATAEKLSCPSSFADPRRIGFLTMLYEMPICQVDRLLAAGANCFATSYDGLVAAAGTAGTGMAIKGWKLSELITAIGMIFDQDKLGRRQNSNGFRYSDC